jgi:hypothetical protein
MTSPTPTPPSTATTSAPSVSLPGLQAQTTVTETTTVTSTTGYPPVDTSDALRTSAWTTGSIALAGALLTASVAWWLGRRNAKAAERSAAAAETNAKTAQAAQEVAEYNKHTAEASSRAALDSAAAAKESAAAATRNAESSNRSSAASEKSAHAAQEAVGLNRETAAGVAQRAHQDALEKRYQAAADQLGHTRAAVRLAGAYAMARLADDWTVRRQECVDVLCAYLRMPWSDAERSAADESDTQLRRTILRLISAHLLDADDANSWCDLRFDLSRARLVDFDMRDIVFRRRPIFAKAVFEGRTYLFARFLAGADLSNCEFSGRASLYFNFVDERLKLNSLRVNENARVRVRFAEIKGSISMQMASVAGALDIELVNSPAPQGMIYITSLVAEPTAVIEVTRTHILLGPQTPMYWASTVFSGWRIRNGARISLQSGLIGRDTEWGKATIEDGAFVDLDAQVWVKIPDNLDPLG